MKYIYRMFSLATILALANTPLNANSNKPIDRDEGRGFDKKCSELSPIENSNSLGLLRPYRSKDVVFENDEMIVVCDGKRALVITKKTKGTH